MEPSSYPFPDDFEIVWLDHQKRRILQSHALLSVKLFLH
jgi:hypothetical protein